MRQALLCQKWYGQYTIELYDTTDYSIAETEKSDLEFVA